MLQRNIIKQIKTFYKGRPNKGRMIVGARHVGKPFIVKEFCKAHYESFVKIDFIENPDYISALAGAESTEALHIVCTVLLSIPTRSFPQSLN